MIFRFLKKLIYSKSYLTLYPMSGKKVCDILNSCDVTDNTDLSNSVNELYRLTLSEGNLLKLDEETALNQLNDCYRQKKVKLKDEETNKKVVEEVSVVKKRIGIKQDLNEYQNRLDKINADSDAIQNLANALENATLSEEHLPLCNAILSKNKIAKRVYIMLLVLVVAILVISFINTII